MKDGFIKVAAASPEIRVADCIFNAQAAIEAASQAAACDVRLLVLPELCLTGYTCGDLFSQIALLTGARDALQTLCKATCKLDLLIAVGLPIETAGKLFNCAAVVYHGRVLGIVPKTCLPNYGEFYEKRQFSSAEVLGGQTRMLSGFGEQATPFGVKLLFCCEQQKDFVFGVEICEDLWSPQPVSIAHATAGASVIANLSASNETLGKDVYRRELVVGQSARLVCGYIYADAGAGESTTDMVFAGHHMIAENGALLAQTQPFEYGMAISEIDVCRMMFERRRLTTYPAMQDDSYMRIAFSLPEAQTALTREISAAPFIPKDTDELAKACEMTLRIQSHALKKRMEHTRAKTMVIGISGGLDSALALLASVRTADLLGWERPAVTAVTMPCFGTTARTKSNAIAICEGLGVALREVDITGAVERHFSDIGQEATAQDVTYENAQARERTQVLMDIANQRGGLVVGTGDLSELALGWATYNGDHMSMYGVNASIPKTFARELVAYEARRLDDVALCAALLDIVDTPVSPELLPPSEGEIQQKTEEVVGPYELHDFFLFYAVRWGFPPLKIYRLARCAFAGQYDDATILHWLKTFLRRFFAQQFKRSCLPDGPKIGSVSLSPRGDWRMPSDAIAALWLAEL